MRADRGFSLIEVLVALGLMAFLAQVLTSGTIANTNFNQLAEERTRAAFAAQRVLDELRLVDPTSLPSSGFTEGTTTIDGKSFAYVVYYCEDSDFCTTPRVRHLTVEVDYAGERRFVLETVYAQLR